MHVHMVTTMTICLHRSVVALRGRRLALFVLAMTFTYATHAQTTLEARTTEAVDLYGNAVAIDEDYAIVGAVGRDVLGAAYLFKRTGTGWHQQATLTPRDPFAARFFGSAVAIEGDFAVVGASKEDPGGVVYVYHCSQAGWTEQARLTSNNVALSDQFGASVASQGAYVVVGAPMKNAARGMVYVFMRRGSTWVEEARLEAPDAVEGSRFGTSVAISGGRIIVGAPGRDADEVQGAGAAYLFEGEGNRWRLQAQLTVGDAAPGDHFGSSVALDGDRALIGAYLANHSAGDDAGAAYVYERFGTKWYQQARLASPKAAAQDLFGWSVALAGDVAVVGAYLADYAGYEDRGGAYIFQRDGTAWYPVTLLTTAEAVPRAWFSFHVAVSGTHVIVGAPFERTGRAYIYPLFNQVSASK